MKQYNEELIKSYMSKLSISREEAIQLIEDDEEDFIGEEGEELTEKAKATTIREVSAEKKERKPREKKVDTDKAKIIEIINKALLDNGYNSTITNVDKSIDFNCYTVNLVKHRPKKG